MKYSTGFLLLGYLALAGAVYEIFVIANTSLIVASNLIILSLVMFFTSTTNLKIERLQDEVRQLELKNNN